MIYLDYASRTPPCDAALRVYCDTESAFWANANASHRPGRATREELTRITAATAGLIGARSDEILYTQGASEGNIRAITGLARAYRHKGRHILSTCFAHPSESAALAELAQEGYEIEILRTLPHGAVDANSLRESLRTDTVLVCVSAADSELGIIQDIRSIADITRAHTHCHLHIDAAQAMGKVELPPFSALGASTLVFSPHKFYGVGGCGVLVRRKGIILDDLYEEPGTPAPGLPAACLAALEEARREQTTRSAQVSAHNKRLIQALSRYPLVRLNSPAPGTPGHNPYIINISVAGVYGTVFRDALDSRGVCISVKAACATDTSPSRAVLAVSNKQNARCSWRISLSHLTTDLEIREFLRIFDDCYNALTHKGVAS